MIARVGVALLAGALALVVVPARRADACGDSGGGSSSSGSSSSGGSGDSGYDSTVAYSPPCEDGSEVVGYRTCTPYGAWSTTARLPRVSLDVGLWSSMISLAGIDVGGTMSHDDGTSYAYRITGTELGGQADVVGVRTRLLGKTSRYPVLKHPGGGVVLVRAFRPDGQAAVAAAGAA